MLFSLFLLMKEKIQHAHASQKKQKKDRGNVILVVMKLCTIQCLHQHQKTKTLKLKWA
jgi:hypothetical protein